MTSGRPGTVVVLALVMTIVTWPPMSLVAQAGIDTSWQTGLAMAFVHHIAWGPHIDFTYGPLGFLITPTLYYASTSILSVLYLLASRFALFALLQRSARRKFPPYWSLLATFVVGASVVLLVDAADVLMGCALLIAVEAIEDGSKRAVSYWTVALAVLAGAGLLVKFSVGLLGFGLAAVVVASKPKWRPNAASVAACFVATVLVAWVATGNAVTNMLVYLRMSTAIASGYSGAMSLEVGRVNEWYYAAILLPLLGACAAWGSRTSARRRQICVALAYLGFAWVALKEGYVRHDGHDLEFFGLMLVGFLAVPWPGYQRAGRLAGALGLATVFTWTAAGAVPSNIVSLSSDTHYLATDLHTILSRSRRDAAISAEREALQAGYALPSSFQAQLRGQTVAIETYEDTLAWAFPDFTWDPEPVLQQYSAYGSSLDHLEANFLRSAAAPRRILVQPPVPFEGIDQDPFFEPPTTNVVTLCRYAQLGASANWQLLTRVPDRCGRLVPIGSHEVGFGQTVAVPVAPAGDAVLARFYGVGSSLLYRAENFVLKARAISMRVPGASYRFIARTGDDLHILRAPATLGYAAAYSPTPISSFTLIERNLLTVGGRYRVSFYELPIAPAKPA